MLLIFGCYHIESTVHDKCRVNYKNRVTILHGCHVHSGKPSDGSHSNECSYVSARVWVQVPKGWRVIGGQVTCEYLPQCQILVNSIYTSFLLGLSRIMWREDENFCLLLLLSWHTSGCRTSSLSYWTFGDNKDCSYKVKTAHGPNSYLLLSVASTATDCWLSFSPTVFTWPRCVYSTNPRWWHVYVYT